MNKNNKGFTLVEIISVISILVLITAIAVPSVITLQKNKKEREYKNIVSSIKTGAEAFAEYNRQDIPFKDNVYYVQLNTLVNLGYVKAPIIDPRTDKEINLKYWVRITKLNDKSLKYEFPVDGEGNIPEDPTKEPTDEKNPNVDPSVQDQTKQVITMKLKVSNPLKMDSELFPISEEKLKSYVDVEYKLPILERYKRLVITPSKVTNSTEVKYVALDLIYGVSSTISLKINLVKNPVAQLLPNCKKNDSGVYEGECTFKGSDPNNYLWYSGFEWRVIGVNGDGTIKMITKNPVTNIAWGQFETYEESYPRQWLNDLSSTDKLDGIFYNALKDPTKYLVKKAWDTGDWISDTEKPSTFEDYVGMLSYLEYENASEDEERNYQNKNWLNINSTYMLINSERYYHHGDAIYDVIDYHGKYSDRLSGSRYDNIRDVSHDSTVGVRPVVNLRNDVQFSKGTGEKDNPYMLEGDTSASVDTYLSKRYPGEYVTFSGQTWRISEIKSNKAKIILNDVVRNSNGSIIFKDYDSNIEDWYNYPKDCQQYGNYNPTKSGTIAYYLNNTYYNSLSDKSLISADTFHSSLFGNGYGMIEGGFNTSLDYRSALQSHSQMTVEYLPGYQSGKIQKCTYKFSDVSAKIGLPNIGELFSGSDLYNFNTWPISTCKYAGSSRTYSCYLGLISSTQSGHVEYQIIALSMSGVAVAHYANDMIDGYMMRPTLYLNSTVKIKGGSGTPDDPYTIGT